MRVSKVEVDELSRILLSRWGPVSPQRMSCLYVRYITQSLLNVHSNTLPYLH